MSFYQPLPNIAKNVRIYVLIYLVMIFGIVSFPFFVPNHRGEWYAETFIHHCELLVYSSTFPVLFVHLTLSYYNYRLVRRVSRTLRSYWKYSLIVPGGPIILSYFALKKLKSFHPNA